MNSERYVISRRDEEGDCQQCAVPLLVGDDALETNNGIYCGKSCAGKAREDAKRTRAKRERIRRWYRINPDAEPEACEVVPGELEYREGWRGDSDGGL